MKGAVIIDESFFDLRDLREGANTLRVTGRLTDEPESSVTYETEVFCDSIRPDLYCRTEPRFVTADALVVLEAFVAEPDLTVESCINACESGRVTMAPSMPGNSKAFQVTHDLNDAAVQNGDVAQIHAFATDVIGNERKCTVDVVLMSDPIVIADEVTDADFGIAASGVGARVWTTTQSGGATSVVAAIGSPFFEASRITLNAAGASRPRAAAFAFENSAFVWLEDSSRTTNVPGQNGVVHLLGNTEEIIVRGDTASVESADIAIDGFGNTIVVYEQAGELYMQVKLANAEFGPAIVLSDVPALEIRGAVVETDGVTGTAMVAWLELSARDGSADDIDPVILSVDLGNGLPGPAVLIDDDVATAGSATSLALAAGVDTALVAFVADSSAVALAAIADDLLVGGTFSGDIVVATPPESQAVTDVTLAGSPIDCVVGWLESNASLLGGASAPGFIVREGAANALLAPLVVSTLAASSPSVARAPSGGLELTWVEAGELRYLAAEF